MPEVHRVTVQLDAPRGDYPGSVTTGYYVIEGDKLTMTDGDGKPVRGPLGDISTARLNPGDDAHKIAGRLTRTLRTSLRGDDRAGFGRTIHYSKTGVA